MALLGIMGFEMGREELAGGICDAGNDYKEIVGPHSYALGTCLLDVDDSDSVYGAGRYALKQGGGMWMEMSVSSLSVLPYNGGATAVRWSFASNPKLAGSATTVFFIHVAFCGAKGDNHWGFGWSGFGVPTTGRWDNVASEWVKMDSGPDTYSGWVWVTVEILVGSGTDAKISVWVDDDLVVDAEEHSSIVATNSQYSLYNDQMFTGGKNEGTSDVEPGIDSMIVTDDTGSVMDGRLLASENWDVIAHQPIADVGGYNSDEIQSGTDHGAKYTCVDDDNDDDDEANDSLEAGWFDGTCKQMFYHAKQTGASADVKAVVIQMHYADPGDDFEMLGWVEGTTPTILSEKPLAHGGQAILATVPGDGDWDLEKFNKMRFGYKDGGLTHKCYAVAVGTDLTRPAKTPAWSRRIRPPIQIAVPQRY